MLTLRFDSQMGEYDDRELASFSLRHRVTSSQFNFFEEAGRHYCSVALSYEPLAPSDGGPDASDKPVMSPEQERQYELLGQWRLEVSRRKGLPAYMVATNAQLSEMVLSGAKSLQGLSKVRGFGRSKLDSYGKQILEVMAGIRQPEVGKPKGASHSEKTKATHPTQGEENGPTTEPLPGV